jgi:hypothetical protein
MTMLERESKIEATTGVLPKVAIVMSSIALVASAFALGAVAQSGLTDRDEIENRLQCLELPGPNDCGVDGR